MKKRLLLSRQLIMQTQKQLNLQPQKGLELTAETGRVTAEGGRVTAETGRTTAETARVTLRMQEMWLPMHTILRLVGSPWLWLLYPCYSRGSRGGRTSEEGFDNYFESAAGVWETYQFAGRVQQRGPLWRNG